MCGGPTTPFISNLPTGGGYGGSFVAVVETNGDGTKFVTSASPSVCTVGGDGLTVHYIGLGVCLLSAHVTAGVTYEQADGSPQTFTVTKGLPSTPRITNLPAGARVGGSFTAVISTNGDGITSLTTGTPFVCTVGASGLAVRFAHVGSCSLTAHVSAGVDFLGATGNPQSVTVRHRRFL